MQRPCFLVVDREYSGSISTRKLVIETAKLNVITAYSGAEAIETLKRFPNIDGAVIDAGIKDTPCVELLKQLAEVNSKIPLIVIDTPLAKECPGATHYLKSFEPAKLLELLKQLKPQQSAAIEARNEKLSKTQDYPDHES
jgi:DNA-binding NtrC family response regulator